MTTERWRALWGGREREACQECVIVNIINLFIYKMNRIRVELSVQHSSNTL